MLSTLKRWTKKCLVGPYDGWLIEPAMRYLPMVRILKHLGCQAPIVEIGSGASGIAPYLGQRVFGVDTGFVEPIHPLLQPITASALQLPFAAGSQPCVVSTDMLEHIPQELRQGAVDELVRVTRNTLILAVPAGPGSELQDQELSHLYIKENGIPFPFLLEHVENGLPAITELRALVEGSLRDSGRSATTRYLKNSNLRIRMWIMRLWIRTSHPYAWWFWISLNHLHPILSRMNFGECYRTMAVVTFADDSGGRAGEAS